jgi:hypothetical protein
VGSLHLEPLLRARSLAQEIKRQEDRGAHASGSFVCGRTGCTGDDGDCKAVRLLCLLSYFMVLCCCSVSSRLPSKKLHHFLPLLALTRCYRFLIAPHYAIEQPSVHADIEPYDCESAWYPAALLARAATSSVFTFCIHISCVTILGVTVYQHFLLLLYYAIVLVLLLLLLLQCCCFFCFRTHWPCFTQQTTMMVCLV